jgi:hypothetical protein
MVKVVAGLQEMGVQGVVDRVKYAKKMMVVEMVRLDHRNRVIRVVTDEREQWVRMVILVVVVVEVRRKKDKTVKM